MLLLYFCLGVQESNTDLLGHIFDELAALDGIYCLAFAQINISFILNKVSIN